MTKSLNEDTECAKCDCVNNKLSILAEEQKGLGGRK